jgi:fumarate reductase subunit D
LSKGESKWAGLVLPIITFIFSLIYVLNIAATENVGQTIVLIITTFLLTNIPTVILLSIYFSVKRRKVHE